ncbi:NADP-dependent oxidoreductase domain-containing protein [Lentinula lateritia]|uniref:NADP-dependent oxidoreductase domain-containing protein n=1 Tax=Lentinula aff. lateritia TaxID=2804960 RepID=A0ACC1U6G3_9AGAR|nr:NADP-dependent oxidoreductase domain-containing protein [Lentinula aff. lateritia]KAJ3855573.1 NADP-dependent oxidoreductase domain-containing protein [Lentinula lateritia]
MPLEPIPLNDGNKIPSIAYGTGSKMKFHDITQYIEQAIETGFSHIDTAVFYKTEKFVGRAIKESGLARSELFVTTKYFGEVPVQKSVRESLKNLGLHYLDLYLIHQPRVIPDLVETWNEFEKVQQDGLAKSIGVSNVVDVQQLEHLIKLSRVKPAVNQIKLHPYNYLEMKPIIDACAKHNIVVEAYSSLSPITTYPGGPVDVPLKAAAQRIGATPTQVVFLWVKAKGAVIVTTTTTKAHMEEYLAVADLPSLTKEEVIAIDTAGAQGPPSDIVTKLRATNTKEKILVALVVMMFGVYGLSMFGRMCQ